MLTQEYRPKTFSEIEGQVLPKKIMRAIVKNPKEAPRSIILHGKYGTGKSSMAKVFARALNCESSGSDACMNCDTCKEFLEYSSYYREYDSAVMGSKSKLENIKDEFHYSVSNGWRVINLEEIQVSSKKAQSVLLRTLEEITSDIFVVFCTTELDKVLDTIRSRSLEIEFKGVDKDYIKRNLKKICNDKGSKVNDSTLELISTNSNGSVRDAQMFLDELFLLGEEEFNNSFYDSKEYFVRFIISALEDNKNDAIEALNVLMDQDLKVLEKEFYLTIQEIVEVWSGFKKNGDRKINIISDLLSENALILLKYSQEDWIAKCFRSDISFKNSMLGFYQILHEM